MTKILMIEDNEISQMTTEQLAMNFGCEIVIVETVDDALAIEDETFDYVLCDYHLPGGKYGDDFMLERKLETPCYFNSSDEVFSDEELVALGYEGRIKKDVGLEEWFESVVVQS